MSCVFTLLGLLVVAFFVGPWVFAGIHHRRQRELDARLVALEGQIARMGARLDRSPVAPAAEAAPGDAEDAASVAMAAVAEAAGAPVTAAETEPAAGIERYSVATEIATQIAKPIARPIATPIATPLVASPAGVAAVPPAVAMSTADASAVPMASAAAATASPLDSMASAAEIGATFDVGSRSASPPPPPPPGVPPGGPPSGAAGGAQPPAGGLAAPRIDWERWIGVRGAAVLGGVVLALAGILFVRYTIERGLISPAVRVALGILAGLASIGWSLRLRSRGYRINADALAGAGIVLLYAAVWAAHSLYAFVGAGPAYALMSLITVACGVMSWRAPSLLIAVLGLAGGFATPFLLATSTDNPIGLFGYVLLLDLGLIGLARRRGWSALALLALAGTLFYQAFWLFTRMQADGALLGLAIVALFALVFGLAGFLPARRVEATPTRGWIAAEAAGLLAPFAFTLYFASRADLGPRLYPVAALLLLLSLAAQWVGRRHGGTDVLSAGAAAGSLATVLVWSWDVVWTPGLVWEAVAICVVLAVAFHLFFEIDVRAAASPSVSTLVAVVGFLAVLVLSSFDATDSPWPWFAGWALTGAMVARQSIDPRRAFTPLIAAIGLASGVAGWFLVARREPGMPAPELYFGVALLTGAAFHLLALHREDGAARRFSDLGAAAYPAVLLLALAIDGSQPSIRAGLFLAVTLLLGLLLVLAVTRLESGEGYLMGMLLLAFTHGVWSSSDAARGAAILALIVFVVTVAALAFWPSFAPPLGRSRSAWRAAALAAPLWFWPMGRLWEARLGDRALGLLPLMLAAITLAAAYRGRGIWTAENDAARTAHLAWFGAIVLGFAAIAVPLQLEKEWITVGWALEGLAVTALWRRLDHPGLKYFGVALFGAVVARLLLNPMVLTYHDREGLPILNWLAYTYLVPAGCLLGAARILGGAAPAGGSALPLEVARSRPWEGPLYSSLRPVLAASFALAAILVVFVWINLTIIDAFATGPTLAFSFDRLPARDLTLSLAWVVYAVVLLGIGMARDSGALRWLSLGFLVLSIGKVFLYDLGELEDLYRVASLVGLAFSLILVSLAYQRFVFRRRAADGSI